ncbi:MAG: monovalent cation/H(+) antiporter subunit G [Planctomycetota bacterium]
MSVWALGLALVAVVIGTGFSIVGVMGLLRFPDAYSRLHAVGKVSVFAVSILLVAAVVLGVAAIGKAIVLMVFLALAGPVLSHALARAARRVGVEPMEGLAPAAEGASGPSA